MPKKTSEPESAEDIELVHSLHLRISERTRGLLRQRAAKSGIKSATWARIALDRALGLR